MSNIYIRIVLVGPPGAGKSTQAEVISKTLGVSVYSTGAILRSMMKGKDRDAVQARRLIKGNLLADQEFMFHILKRAITDKDFILDGFPRNLPQLYICMERLPFNIMIFLNVDRKEAYSRILLRYTCNNCNLTYSKNEIRLKNPTCKNCGSKLTRRSDDQRSKPVNKMHVYENETRTMIETLKDKPYFVEINGSDPKEVVTKKIFHIVGKRMKALGKF